MWTGNEGPGNRCAVAVRGAFASVAFAGLLIASAAHGQALPASVEVPHGAQPARVRNSASTNPSTSTAAGRPPRDSRAEPARPGWRRFGPWDYLGTAAVLGVYAGVESMPDPTSAPWTAPIPVIDTPARNLLRAASRHGREQADRASDYLWYASIGYPVAEAAIVPLAVDRDTDKSLQLTLMNLQALAVSTLITRLPHKTVGRLRPNHLGCEAEGPTYDEQCGRASQDVSFPSGHTAMSFTGAGLSCAHHLHGHLYGISEVDASACGLSVAAAAAVAVLRVRADRHWASDSLYGVLTGFGVGYGLPTLLYYHPFWRNGTAAEHLARASSASPRAVGTVVPTGDGVVAVLVGLF